MLANYTRILAAMILLQPMLTHAQESPADIPASAFARLDQFVDAEISPDGNRMAFLHPADGRWGIHVYTFADGNTFRIPPGEGMDYNWLHWANDRTIVFSVSYASAREFSLFYTRARQFTETVETRLMAFDVGTDTMISLIKPAQVKGNANSRIQRRSLPPAHIQDNVIGWMPDDPNHILVSLDEDQDAAAEVRKINLTTGDYEIVRGSRNGIQQWMADASGEIRFGYGYRGSEFLARLKSADGKWITLTRTDWYNDGWFLQGFTSNPSQIYVTGPGEHGTREVRVLNIVDGSFLETLYSDPTYDAASIISHPLTGQASGVSYITHRREHRYFDKELNRLQRTMDKMFPSASNTITGITRDKQRVVFETATATDPGTVYVWDLSAKTMEPFGRKNPFIDPSLMGQVEAVEYPSDDGTVIPAYLTLPAQEAQTNLPTVILPHGGPAARDQKSFWFLSQFLASRGYAVLQPNFRGSEGYGYEFENAGRGQWGGLMQDDVTAGATWLAEQGIADKDRICIVGWSYGGYAATMGLVNSPDVYRCAVSINALYDLPKLIADDNNKDYVGSSVWARHMDLDGGRAQTVSPIHQANRIQSPLLIVHAEDDERVQVSQANDMYQRLKKDDKPVRFIKLPHGGHSMVNESSRLSILESVEAFLEENLGAK